jgi:hypothetical protein
MVTDMGLKLIKPDEASNPMSLIKNEDAVADV